MREVIPKTCIKRGDSVKSRLPLTSFCIALFLGSALAQTYDINGPGTPAPKNQGSKAAAADTPQESTNPSQSGSELSGSDLSGSSEQGFGWGSSIEVSRQVRAAEDALKRNDYAAAVGFAERAAKSAPQNAELWFLLGYAERLDDHYGASVEAYSHGLKIQPGSIRGMAGLAQTYAKMGRDADAEQLLKRV